MQSREGDLSDGRQKLRRDGGEVVSSCPSRNRHRDRPFPPGNGTCPSVLVDLLPRKKRSLMLRVAGGASRTRPYTVRPVGLVERKAKGCTKYHTRPKELKDGGGLKDKGRKIAA